MVHQKPVSHAKADANVRSDKRASYIPPCTCVPKQAINVTQADKAPFHNEYTFYFAKTYF